MTSGQLPSAPSAASRAADRLLDHSARLWETGYSPVAASLLTAGVRCFAASGYHATTTRDITSAVGLSPAALYVHFSSKEHLLFEIVRTSHQHVLDTIQAVATDTDSATRLRQLVFRFVCWHAHHHVAGRVGQYELAALSPEHHVEILTVRRNSRSIIRDAVARGVTDGQFQNVHVAGVARAILSLGVDVVRWYRLDGPDPPEKLAAFYADLALGMVSPPGAAPGQQDHVSS